jgi:hypothetical protein
MQIQNYLPTGRIWDSALSVLNARKRLGYYPKIGRPSTFNEYILSQKWRFNGDLNLARRITEKGQVKDWLVDLRMEHLIVPTIGIFNRIDEIEAFHFEGEIIAKSTHGSGEAIIRTAKSGVAFTPDDLQKFCFWLQSDYYRRSREPNYKGIPKRIIVEPLLRDETGNPPKDFKFFCAYGEPFLIQVDHGRYTEHTRQLYSTNWQLMDFSMCYPRKPEAMPPPIQLTEALETARKLSSGFGFVRVDFYFMPEGLKLGEMTFFPGNGAEKFQPEHGDRQLGKVIQLLSRG